MLLHDVLSKATSEYPERPAILYKTDVITYGDLAAQARAFAGGLVSLGVKPGERVALLMPNIPPFTVAYYGALMAGAIAVPANPLLKAAELTHIWGDSGARCVVTIPQLLATATEAAGAVGMSAVLCAGDTDAMPSGVTPLADFMRIGAATQVPPCGTAPDDPAVFIYTSGTTGRPKGAMLSHRNLLTNCEQINAILHFGPDDNLLCVLPLFHSFAGTVCQNAALYSGSRATLVEQFHPARVLEILTASGVTIFPGVPAMYAALLQFAGDHKADLSGLRLCVSGGAPMPTALMAAFEKRFATTIIEGDGPTECSPVTSVNPPFGVRKPGTIGLPVPGCEMRIFDENDQEAPTGEVGEIVVRGANVMLGYHNQPEETAEAMRNGWYHTGDLGKVDEDGYFTIVDRKKDMLIVGGINVYPREIEEVLYAHPAVADAAVIGAHDPLRGDEVVAVLTLKPGVEFDERELRAYCRRRLANFKVPRRVIVRDTMPRSDTGKILKRLLRKELDLESGSQA